MYEPTIVQEIWTYRCAACQHEWDVAYEEWHAGDGHGGDVVTYRRSGQRCVTPWTELTCVNCGRSSVTPLPSLRSVRPAVPVAADPVQPSPSVPRQGRAH